MPFRLVGDEQKFKKWQWIEARIEKSHNDHRPESHKIYIDTIQLDDGPMPSGEKGWAVRRQWLAKVAAQADFGAVEQCRQAEGSTLALLRPKRILGLDITKAGAPDWTEDEKQKLLQMEQQIGLFDEVEDGKKLRLLKKIPFDFHYRYECEVNGATTQYKHKVVDWEIGALYWNVRAIHGDAWEVPFRKRMEAELPATDLMFLMGTFHRFPDQWLIVSVIYPPKLPPGAENQLALFAN